MGIKGGVVEVEREGASGCVGVHFLGCEEPRKVEKGGWIAGGRSTRELQI